jgi:hypothetical protein
MRTLLITIASTILFAGVPSASAGETRDERIARILTERAGKRLAAADTVDGRAASLRHLRTAVRDLERARRLDRDAAEGALVRALNRLSEIHLQRRALPRARRANDRALEIDVRNATARALSRRITAASGIDLDDQFDGATALRRLAERRASAGLSYRPRGIAKRR